MKLSILKGVSFGLTSGIITTLGLMVGLQSSTHSQAVVVGGILTIAIADAFSDAMGMHISQESESKNSTKEVWESTIATFLAKLFFASTFIIPVLIWDLEVAIWVSIAWGMLILALISYWMAATKKESVLHVVGEHLGIAILVIAMTHIVGDWIGKVFA